jgi:hypothetical protein
MPVLKSAATRAELPWFLSHRKTGEGQSRTDVRVTALQHAGRGRRSRRR